MELRVHPSLFNKQATLQALFKRGVPMGSEAKKGHDFYCFHRKAKPVLHHSPCEQLNFTFDK